MDRGHLRGNPRTALATETQLLPRPQPFPRTATATISDTRAAAESAARKTCEYSHRFRKIFHFSPESPVPSAAWSRPPTAKDPPLTPLRFMPFVQNLLTGCVRVQ